MVVNTPTGPAARHDGYEIRAATTSMDRPIITTVQQLGAAVQGIESARSGEISVRSLQEHAAHPGPAVRAGRPDRQARASIYRTRGPARALPARRRARPTAWP